MTLSALTSRGIQKLLPEVAAVYEIWNKRVSTGPLNRWLQQVVERHPPPISRGRRIRIRYITQSKPDRRPSSFRQPTDRCASLCQVSDQRIRETFDFPGSLRICGGSAIRLRHPT